MTGSLQIKKGYDYAVLNIADKEGRVHQKWIASGLPIKNNKRRAEEFLRKTISDSEKQHTLFTEKNHVHRLFAGMVDRDEASGKSKHL